MRFTPRVFFNADTAIASPPASNGSLADSVLSAIATKTAPAHPFQVGAQTFYSRNNGQTTAVPIETTPAPTMESPAVVPGTPPEPQTQAQDLQTVVNEPPAPASPAANDPSEGGKYIIIRNPENGQFITRIKNDPDVIANFVAHDKLYIKSLKESFKQPQVTIPSAPPAPTADQLRAADVQRARDVASKHFPKTYNDGTPLDLNPMAETLADLVGQVRTEFRSEFEQRERTAQQAQIVAQQDQELATIMQEDPSFTLDAPDVVQLRQQFPNAGPTEIQALRIYKQFQHFRANPPSNPTPNPAPQSPPAQAPPQKVPDSAWMQPAGSSAPPQSGYDTHPYVIAAIDTHRRMAPTLGQPITPDSIERIKQIAISTIKNTEAAKGGFR